MSYLVNEIFYTIQGEGFWTGRPAVFCRFSQCNLWTGREGDRASAICKFCDTDFTAHTEYELEDLVDAITDVSHGTLVVLTGGEPALQINTQLIEALHERGFYIAIETNGTKPLPDGIDWICVSPKTPRLRVVWGDELKLVYPQSGRMQPEMYERLNFKYFWLSPMDGPDLIENTAAAVEYVKNHPEWRLNIQTHKYVGIR